MDLFQVSEDAQEVFSSTYRFFLVVRVFYLGVKRLDECARGRRIGKHMSTAPATIQMPGLSVIAVCDLYIVFTESARVEGPLFERDDICAGTNGAVLEFFKRRRTFVHLTDSRNV
jgi:hypothetical protein